MSMNENYFNKATEQLLNRRAENQSIQEKRRAEVDKKIPEYAQLEALLAETSGKLITIMLRKDDNREEQLKQLKQGNLSMQKNMSALLVQAGFPEDYLSPVYTCEKCKDKGTFNGKWCECFYRLMLNAAADELNAVSPLKLSSFDNFSLEYYSEETDPALGTSPRVIMAHNLEVCKHYVEDFRTNSDSLFLNGGTGLGKTHLSLAVADAVIKKGYNVVYCSVPEITRKLEKEYFGKSDENTMDALTQCDLLILDDLGAEMDKPLYTSLVYELINTRINRGVPMVINSNLTAPELKERYQDRIWSRLFSTKVLVFAGTDIRRKVKK